MRRLQLVLFAIHIAPACGGGQSSEPGNGPTEEASRSGGSGGEEGAGEAGVGEAGAGEAGAGNEFQLGRSDTAGQAHGEHPSQIEATRTQAAMRLFVVDPEAGPIAGIVIKMTAPDGTEYFTEETDSQGYAEVLVPVGQRYGMEYLSLGRRNSTANVEVPAGPNQDIRLTLRYRRRRAAQPAQAAQAAQGEPQRFVLEGIEFDSGRATIRPESNARLDRIVEYLRHKASARIRVAGYTDNVGNPRTNQTLSEQRAQAVRAYLVSQGIDGGRVEAVGHGDQSPIAPNDTEEGRQQNRRIEATEL
ncbi:MAG: OmpA family protein [Deltaproteobacteria bacterium]|nr:OmpA family protein [Deltaproteobacteria bacterium]